MDACPVATDLGCDLTHELSWSAHCMSPRGNFFPFQFSEALLALVLVFFSRGRATLRAPAVCPNSVLSTMQLWGKLLSLLSVFPSCKSRIILKVMNFRNSLKLLLVPP